MKYRVDQAGRSGRAALLTDTRTHEVVLRLVGPDRFVVADALASVLNTSKTETPIERAPRLCDPTDPELARRVANLLDVYPLDPAGNEFPRDAAPALRRLAREVER